MFDGHRPGFYVWILITAAVAAFVLYSFAPYAGWAWRRVTGGSSVQERLQQYGPAARRRLKPHFRRAGVEYPPDELAFIGIKEQKVLQVWARRGEDEFVRVRHYPIVAASGHLGPKLREGDRQVPEGLYRIESLHPNSMYHLALRVNYPNAFDRRHGRDDGRENLGGDIIIHGSDGSVGCLAMGDQAAEDLFVLAADTGVENIRLILTPVDFRTSEMPGDAGEMPPWTDELNCQIRRVLEQFPLECILRKIICRRRVISADAYRSVAFPFPRHRLFNAAA